MKAWIAKLQPMGRALMLPIAVLPVAALLLRLGQPDLLDVPAIAAAGDAIFSNLGLLFAVGVAVGLARENHGAAGLAAIVGYLVATQGAKVLIEVPASVTAGVPEAYQALATQAFLAKELTKLSVPVGLLTGLIAGWAFNRFGDIRLPAYLAFFGGRRFVPIVSGFAGLLLALVFGFFWQPLEQGMDQASQVVLASEEYGLFTYGVLNRVLIVTGLHHILNNIAWFLLGDFNGVTGDLKRFFAGDPTAGAFMSGFFPVMMFGLPGACLAMYRTASPERRRAVGGLLFSMALTSFLTGVTEPIEFAFMFLAPVLYALHALLTGLSMVLMHALDVRLGFGFSAGLFDYVLNYSLSSNPLWLIPVGLGYFALYFVLFRWFILRFDLKTLGRDREEPVATADGSALGLQSAQRWIAALGGVENLRSVEACTTRLRLTVVDARRVVDSALTPLGSRGVLRLADGAVQVVVGPMADQLAAEIRSALRTMPVQPSAGALLAALGGRDNVRTAVAQASRVIIEVADDQAVDARALQQSGFRAAACVAPRRWHVIVGAEASTVAGALRD